MATDLTALLAELQDATDGSRELDMRVALASGYKRSRLGIGGGFDWVAPDRTLSFLPEFSTSINAALTLVPDGMWWLLDKRRTRPDGALYGAQIMLRSGHGYAVDVVAETEAHTPALAMCCAALRSKIDN